jgi:hypothetical protein
MYFISSFILRNPLSALMCLSAFVFQVKYKHQYHRHELTECSQKNLPQTYHVREIILVLYNSGHQ